MTTLAMIAMGVEIGAALDTYKRFINKKKTILLFINDFLFWVCQGLLIFLVLIEVNEGDLRMILFVALLCGYAAYQSLFRGLYLRLLERMIKIGLATYRLFRSLFINLIIKPVKWLLQLIFALCMMIGTLVYNIFFTIGKFIFKILLWILKRMYFLLPKKIRELVNKGAGYCISIKNKVMKYVKKWRR
jgi:spore cortex biosynthesis protein YabQ